MDAVRRSDLRTIPFSLPRGSEFEDRRWSRRRRDRVHRRARHSRRGKRRSLGGASRALCLRRPYSHHGKRVLDIGCGTGYGCAELAPVQLAMAGHRHRRRCDLLRARALSAPRTYAFLQASATALPFAAAILRPRSPHSKSSNISPTGAVCLPRPAACCIPTASSSSRRRTSSTTPSRVRKKGRIRFTYTNSNLRNSAMRYPEFFPHVTHAAPESPGVVRFLSRNAAFPPHRSASSTARAARRRRRISSSAVCAIAAVPELRTFLYVPRASNVLREREQHIHLLERRARANQAMAGTAQSTTDGNCWKLHAVANASNSKSTIDGRCSSKRIGRRPRQRVEPTSGRTETEQAAATDVVARYSRKGCRAGRRESSEDHLGPRHRRRLSTQLASRRHRARRSRPACSIPPKPR